MPAKVTEQATRPSNVVSIMDALRKSIAVETAKAPVVKSKAEMEPVEEAPAASKPKARSKAKGNPAVAAPAAVAPKARKAK